LGVALGPLLGAALFSLFGMRGTAFLVLPGMAIGLWLIAICVSASSKSRPQ
jgi:Na+/proline symporter